MILYQVNWGRRRCAGHENAQLERLTFSRVGENDTTPVVIDLETPSRLLVRNVFESHAVVVEPGTYILSGFDVKVADSVSDVHHLRPTSSELRSSAESAADDSFTARAGEIVYIGSFGLECQHEAIPWRYYVDGRAEFDGFIAGFRKRFPFVGTQPVEFRLFRSRRFGKPYSLPAESPVTP